MGDAQATASGLRGPTAARWRLPPAQVVVAAPLTVLALGLIPLASWATAVVPALVPAVVTAILMANVLAAALLTRVDAAGRRPPRMLGLAGCYIFSSLMALAFAATYPSMLALGGLFGGPADTVIWVRMAWQMGTVIGLLVVLGLPDRAWERWEAHPLLPGVRSRVGRAILVAPLGLAALGVGAVELAARLGPRVLHGTSYAGSVQVVAILGLGVAGLLAIPAARRMPAASPIERWALMAAGLGAAAFLLAVAAGGRFTLGWDGAWVLWVVSDGLLPMAVLFERNQAARDQRRRAADGRMIIAQALGRLDQGATPGRTAEAICQDAAHLPGVDAAGLLHFNASGTAIPSAVATADQRSPRLPVAAALPPLRTRDLRARAAGGAFVERLDPDAEPEASVRHHLEQLRRDGIRAMAHAPIVVAGRMTGILSVARGGRTDAEALVDLTEALPSLTDLAAVAAALLGLTRQRPRPTAQSRREVEAILEHHTFHPVFQPVVTVADRVRIGHEALTRFDGGAAPDQVFASAAGVGLDQALELACLRAAVAAAAGLEPPGAWLSLNVSPDLLVAAPAELAEVVAAAGRPVVLELTEHVVIDGYGPVREALAQLGPAVRLAVDDAGSGFASLRHILELQPAFIKLDISLVRDLHRDPARQAMIAGLDAFARRTGCALIAEGVESGLELDELRALGVPYAQGFLLGRPLPAGHRPAVASTHSASALSPTATSGSCR